MMSLRSGCESAFGGKRKELFIGCCLVALGWLAADRLSSMLSRTRNPKTRTGT